MTADRPLGKLLEERCNGRVFRIFREHVGTQKGFHCQLDRIDRKEVTIEGRQFLNFNTINYLGLEFHPRMIEAAQEAIARWGTLVGAARSATEMAGYEKLETRIANWLGVDDAIVYTTVTLANHGVIPLLMKKGTLVLMDWEAHSSVQRAGIEAKGGGATLMTFNHDDFEQLEGMLETNRDEYDHVMIALDGIYSMLGTYLDLPRYEELANKYDALLFVDDAHGFGVVGPAGQGIVGHYGSDYDNTIYVASLEKGLASLGGFVILPPETRDFFRYNSYTYLFSGQLPPPYLASALTAFDILEEEGERLRRRLVDLIDHVKRELREMGFELIGEDRPFPLILVKVGDVYAAPPVAKFFFDRGIHVLTVGFPVIPLARGALVRISLSASHTDAQIERLLEAFRALRKLPAHEPVAPVRSDARAREP